MNANLVEQRLIEKIGKLSSTRIVEIEDFIDFLSQREARSDWIGKRRFHLYQDLCVEIKPEPLAVEIADIKAVTSSEI